MLFNRDDFEISQFRARFCLEFARVRQSKRLGRTRGRQTYLILESVEAIAWCAVLDRQSVVSDGRSDVQCCVVFDLSEVECRT